MQNGFNKIEILEACLTHEKTKILKELELYERYYYSGQTQHDFAKENKITRKVIDDIRRRYGLPSPPANAKQVSKLSKRAEKERALCKNADCQFCAFLARVWRIDRKIEDPTEPLQELVRSL